MTPISLSPDNVMGLLAGAIVTLLIGVVQYYTKQDVPAVYATAATTVVYFLVCHFVPVSEPPSTPPAPKV